MVCRQVAVCFWRLRQTARALASEAAIVAGLAVRCRVLGRDSTVDGYTSLLGTADAATNASATKQGRQCTQQGSPSWRLSACRPMI